MRRAPRALERRRVAPAATPTTRRPATGGPLASLGATRPKPPAAGETPRVESYPLEAIREYAETIDALARRLEDAVRRGDDSSGGDAELAFEAA